MAELLLPNGSTQPILPRRPGHWTTSELESLVRGQLAALRANNGRVLITNNRSRLNVSDLGVNQRASLLWSDGDTLRGNVVMARASELPPVPVTDPGAHDLVTQEQMQMAIAQALSQALSGYLPLTGGTLNGQLSVDANLHVSGDIELPGNVNPQEYSDQEPTLRLADQGYGLSANQGTMYLWSPGNRTVVNGDLFVTGAIDPLSRTLDHHKMVATEFYVDDRISMMGDFVDAPIDGDSYIRRDANWYALNDQLTAYATNTRIDDFEQKMHDDQVAMTMLFPLRQDVTDEIADATTAPTTGIFGRQGNSWIEVSEPSSPATPATKIYTNFDSDGDWNFSAAQGVGWRMGNYVAWDPVNRTLEIHCPMTNNPNNYYGNMYLLPNYIPNHPSIPNLGAVRFWFPVFLGAGGVRWESVYYNIAPGANMYGGQVGGHSIGMTVGTWQQVSGNDLKDDLWLVQGTIRFE